MVGLGTSYEVDNTDLTILKILTTDGRCSFKDLSAKVGVSDSTIQYRINRLVKTGIIERFSVQLNLQKLGYPIEVTMGMSVEPHHIDSVASKLTEFPEIYSVWIVTGAHNISCRAAFKSQDGLNATMTKLNKLEGIQQYHLSIASKKMKNIVEVFGLSSLLESEIA